jgi:hypothetical protein
MPIYSKCTCTEPIKKKADFYITAIQAIYLKFLSRMDAKKNKYSILCFLLASKLVGFEIIISHDALSVLEAPNKNGYYINFSDWKSEKLYDPDILSNTGILKLKDDSIILISEDIEMNKLFNDPSMTLLHLLGIFETYSLNHLMNKVSLPFRIKPLDDENTMNQILIYFVKSLNKKYFANGSKKFIQIAETNKIEFYKNYKIILKYFEETKLYTDKLIKTKENDIKSKKKLENSEFTKTAKKTNIIEQVVLNTTYDDDSDIDIDSI